MRVLTTLTLAFITCTFAMKRQGGSSSSSASKHRKSGQKGTSGSSSSRGTSSNQEAFQADDMYTPEQWFKSHSDEDLKRELDQRQQELQAAYKSGEATKIDSKKQDVEDAIGESNRRALVALTGKAQRGEPLGHGSMGYPQSPYTSASGSVPTYQYRSSEDMLSQNQEVYHSIEGTDARTDSHDKASTSHSNPRSAS